MLLNKRFSNHFELENILFRETKTSAPKLQREHILVFFFFSNLMKFNAQDPKNVLTVLNG